MSAINTGLLESNPDSWTPIHTQILLMHSEGRSSTHIANEVKLPIQKVKKILKSPTLIDNLTKVRDTIVQTVVSQRTEILDAKVLTKARRLLEEASVSAAINLVKMSNDPDCKSHVQLKACQDILDRVGIKALVVTETHERVYPPAEVISAKRVLLEAQEIVKRLNNEASPFILGDARRETLASSQTDKAQGS